MTRSRRTRATRAAGVAVVGLTLGFLLLPLIVVIPLSFEPSSVLQFPPSGVSMRWYSELAEDDRWAQSAWLSLRLALVVAVASTALGLSAAVGVRRYLRRGRSLVRAVLIAPLVVPVIVSAVAMYDQFQRLGLDRSFLGLAAAHTVLALPYVVIIMEAALGTIDVSLEDAAMSMGASRWGAFRRVTLPQLLPSVAASAMFAFLTSWDEVVMAIFLAAVGNQTLPLRMFEFVQTQIRPTLAAASTLLTLAVVLVLVAAGLLRRMRQRSLAAATIGG